MTQESDAAAFDNRTELAFRRWGVWVVRHRWWAIGVTAVLFGLVHYTTPHHVPALAAFGFVLGYLYERYGSLTVVMLVHMLFNAKTLLYEFLRHAVGGS